MHTELGTPQENNRRIAKNTLMLYVRMLFGMFVSLYTSRVVLTTLGVEDYGIYNIVGSVVVMLSFLSGPLGAATQRFYNFELGRGEKQKLNQVFNLSLYTYLVLAFIMFAAIEWGGTWYISHKMNFPAGRYDAAMFAFHFSLLSFILSLIKTPYDSLIVAHERMSFYAYCGIFEILLRLGNAITLLYIGVDKLKLYAVNQFAITLIVAFCVWIYSKKHFQYIHVMRVWNWQQFKSLLSFSGWTSTSSISTIAANQGVNVVLNAYCGVVANAAMGVALQLNGLISQLTSNFQAAFNPQIVKYYSSNELTSMRNLVYRASRLSYFLLFVLVCPLFVHIDFILKIWLHQVPPYAGIFCRYLMIWTLLESLMAPLWTSITATGRIRNYHICMSLLISLVFLLSWACLYAGCPPTSVGIVKCLVDVVLLAARLWFVRALIGFSVRLFLKEVLFPVTITTVVFMLLMLSMNHLMIDGWMKLLTLSMLFVVCYIPFVYKVALSEGERNGIKQMMNKKFNF